MYLRLKVIAFSLSLLCFDLAMAVDVHINSGNPAFPFPQFLEYTNGTSHSLGNIGTKNPEGVVHAEMEQDIRDAYQIFANEWTYSGETQDGVKYIRGNIGCPYDCREGDGYSLLAAAVMGDKVSFDGLWMRVHDHSRVREPNYIDGSIFCPGCDYGSLIIGDQNANCSATDGDNEIVLALYIAWRQWGDDSGVSVAGGGTMSYKKELIDVVRGLVAISEERFKTENPRRVTTGDVGLDGYLKNGTTWAEVTDWGRNNPLSVNGVDYIPEFAGPVNIHTDYASPAYFREFYDLILELDVPESSAWEREQYRRCEASCDWIVGNWLQQSAKNLFFGEEASISGDKVSLEAGNQGGRFRSAWRTALNYVWHGNPEYTWNPLTHKVENGGNTFELDWCKRFTNFMNDPQGWDASSSCTEFGGGPSLTYKGPATLHWDILPDGTFPKSEFIFNWISGVGMPAAIGAQDYDLMGVLYRQCDIEWDITTGGDGYLSSVPHYFHGFFRWLGMTMATGNHMAPKQIKAGANMKIYRAIQDSVTCCYTGDQLTYLLDYRNYGSLDAKDVVIVENVPKDFVFVSASNGGVYNPENHTVTWNIGTVSGVKSDGGSGPSLDLTSGNLAKTIGQVSYVVGVGPDAFGRYCTTADITCSNGSGWTTNEYPNYITATMQRNCVDVIMRALQVEKTADVEKVNPGNIVTYTVNFENSSKAGWLDGGRPRVSLAMSNAGLATTQEWLRFRLYNDAIEPYINYGNYRLSYYLYDSNMKCLAGTDGCSAGWGWYTAVYEGKRTPSDEVKVSHETIVEGSDEKGKWNQRLQLQFAPLLVTTTAHLSNYYGMGSRIHRGGTEPLRLFGYIFPSNWAATDFSDDWSWDANAQDAEDGNYHPITPSWQKIDNTTGQSIEIPVTEYLPSVCETPTHTISNVLVEEFDGYVWRRILGNGPMPGREAENVVVIDTLPKGMTFVAFKNTCPLTDYGASWDNYQIADGRWVVKWEIPVMQVKQKGSIIYTAEANFPSGAVCQTDDELTTNVAWILADKNSPLSDTAEVTVTCAKVPDPIIPTTLTKTADKEMYEVGDPITYTIDYEQTHGFVAENALDKASDWTNSGGASISNNSISVPDGSTAKYNYSYASNIYISMNCNVTQYASGEIYLRDNIRLDYKSDWSDITFTCYEGSTLKKTAKIVTDLTKFSLVLNLTDDVLQVWFNKDTTNSADFTAENLTVKSGYFGFKGIEAGNFSYSDIYVHTDYAYDLTIVDRKPAEVSFVSADEGGKLQGDSIVWTFEHGIGNPIPFGTKYTVSWKGTVDECDESIINIAYAKLLGHADNEIMAQAVSTCGASACPLTKVGLTMDADSVCEGKTVKLKAMPTPATGTYKYEFFKDGVSTGAASATATMSVDETAGIYAYTVLVTSEDDATCFLESDTVKLYVEAIPEGEDLDLGTKCPGSFDLTAVDAAIGKIELAGYSLVWYDTDGTTELAAMPDVNSIKVADSYVYTYQVKSPLDCLGDKNKLTFTVGDTVVVDLGEDKIICAGTSATIDAGAGVGYTYEWSDGKTTQTIAATEAGIYDVTVTSAAGCSAKDTIKITVDTVKVDLGEDVSLCAGASATLDAGNGAGYTYEWSGGETTKTIAVTEAGVYSVKVSSVNGCAATDTVEVKIASELKVNLGNDTTICSGATLTLDAGTIYDSYAWNSGETTQTLAVTEAGIYSVSVQQGTCSGTGSIEVKVSTVDAPTGTFAVSYIVGDTASNGQFDKTLTQKDPAAVDQEAGYTYNWYDENKSSLASEPIPAVSAGGGNATYIYYVSRTNSDGCESELKKITVVVSGAPTPEANDVSYCLGETAAALMATPKDDGTSATWTLNWYDAQGTKLTTEADKIPSTAIASEVMYYVSQVSDLGAESGKVPVKVTTYEVGTPDTTGNALAYCATNGAAPISLNANTTGGTTGTTQSGNLVWSIDGVKTTSTPVVDLNVATTTTITYGVKSEYEITTGHVCSSKEIVFDVTVTYVGEPSGDFSVSYVKTEAESGVFASLTDKNPTVATADAGNVLVWYDADGNETGTVSPSPKSDETWPDDEDVTFVYYVSQRNTATGCESERQKVTVTISSMPMPKTTPLGYCQGEAAAALSAVIDDSDGNSYTLVWYDPQTGAELTDAPHPSTLLSGETVYKVAQKNTLTSVKGSASELKVTVYEKPVLSAVDPAAQCGGSVDLSTAMSLTNALTVTRGFYSDPLGQAPVTQLVDRSGTYYSDAYYTVINSATGDVCRSDMANVDVVINDLSGLTIAGDATVCPGGDVTMTASATSVDPGTVDYLWSVEASGTNATYTATGIMGVFGTTHTYTVTVSAGACVGESALTASHVVTVDRGVLDGSMTIDGVSTKTVATCGENKLTLGTTHTGDGYAWFDVDGNPIGTGKSIDVKPTETTTYVLSLVNVCAVSDSVTIDVKPLSATADWTSLSGSKCEGDAVEASLSLTGYDAAMSGAYIKWYKDGAELTAHAGKTELSIGAVAATDGGVYSYEVSNGICQKPETADEGTLTVYAPATYAKDADMTICEGGTAQIGISNLSPADATISWTQDASILSQTDGNKITVEPTETTTYTFTVSREIGCSTTGTVTVLVQPETQLLLSSDTTICEGNKVTVSAKTIGTAIGYEWTETTTGSVMSSTASMTALPSVDVKYRLSVDAGVCGEKTGEVSVYVSPMPKITKVETVKLRDVEITAESGTEPYSYKVGENGSYGMDNVVTVKKYTVYDFYVRDDNGCETKRAYKVEAPGIIIEDYFTPDGDGVKDNWEVANLAEAYPDAVVTIYDRFGKKLCEMKASDGSWDGTYNGKAMPSSDYWYEINIPEIDKMYVGHFTLLRR